MANTKDFFLTVTQRLFSNWTALRLAVEHGMGSKDRAIEFCPYVTEMMYMNEKLENDEIAAELEDYMDTNFRTELEDNSASQVANELLRFYRYCLEGNESLATEELSKLAPLQSWIMTRESIRERNIVSLVKDDETSSESDETDDKRMDTSNDDWVEPLVVSQKPRIKSTIIDVWIFPQFLDDFCQFISILVIIHTRHIYSSSLSILWKIFH